MLPGRDQLAAELNANHKTVETALRQLEKEGLLINPGKGSRRQVTASTAQPPTSLRIAILLSEMVDRSLSYMVDITHQLREAGHQVVYTKKALVELAMNPKRIASLVSSTPADAWIVTSGSLEVLEWFSKGPAPVFALFGAMRGLHIAATAPNKRPAIAEATQALIGHGHRRIALLARPRRRLPV